MSELISRLEEVLAEANSIGSQRQRILNCRKDKNSKKILLRKKEDEDIANERANEDRDLQTKQNLAEATRMVSLESRF
jgi:hypothetical protein